MKIPVTAIVKGFKGMKVIPALTKGFFQSLATVPVATPYVQQQLVVPSTVYAQQAPAQPSGGGGGVSGVRAYVMAPELVLRECPRADCPEKARFPYGTEVSVESGEVQDPTTTRDPWVQVSVPIRNPAIHVNYPTHAVGYVNATYLDFNSGAQQ
jgi:hypothetical protein